MNTRLALVGVLLLAACRSAPAWMQDGMRAPPLSGATVNGGAVDLASERGKAAVVIFFADWCPHCRALYDTERELATRMPGGSFVLIGVGTQNTPNELKEAIPRERITWPVIDDTAGKNWAAWGVDAIPTIYLIDAKGVIRGFDKKGSALVSAADALIAEAKAAK